MTAIAERPIAAERRTDWRYWLLCAAVYATLIYSTGLHFIASRETPLETGFRSSVPLGADAWMRTTFTGDVERYMEQAEGTLTEAPWRYRVLPLAVAGLLGLALPTATAFIVMNVGLMLTTAVLYTWFLRGYGFSQLLALLGGALFLTMSPATATVGFPMLEPASFLAVLLVVITIERNHPLWFAVTAIGAVLTKEVLLLMVIPWVLRNRTIWPAVAPLAAFIAVRLLLGWEQREPDIGRMADIHGPLWLNLPGLLDLGVRVFFAFTFLWAGLWNLRTARWLWPYVPLIPLVLLAAVLFSSHVERPMGILFPIVITSFLLFFERPASPHD